MKMEEGEIGVSKAPKQCLLAAPKRLSILKASGHIGGGRGHAHGWHYGVACAEGKTSSQMSDQSQVTERTVENRAQCHGE